MIVALTQRIAQCTFEALKLLERIWDSLTDLQPSSERRPVERRLSTAGWLWSVAVQARAVGITRPKQTVIVRVRD